MPTEADLRRQRFDFCPWFFPHEATEAERAEQLEYQALLGRVYGTQVGEGSFISTAAAISGPSDLVFTIGRKGFVAGGSYITDSVTLGDNCSVNPYVTLRGKLTAGDGVRIGAYTCMVGFNHGFDRIDIPIYEQPHVSKGIILGDDVWVGAHVTVLDGVRVGSHTILAAGAIVTKDVPDYAIVGGNPARVLRMRK